MKAWLITWEWTGGHAEVTDQVVGIINSRWSEKRVKDIVEFLYAQCHYNLTELTYLYAKNTFRNKKNPYPAERDFNNRIRCGRNPWLFARIVDKLKISTNPDTSIETITWLEPPFYEPSDHGFPKLVREPIPDGFTRRIIGPVSHKLIKS